MAKLAQTRKKPMSTHTPHPHEIFPNGLPSPIKEWGTQDTEWFFGHKVKDVERAWMSGAIRGAQTNKQSHPDRNKRLLGLLALGGVRRATTRCDNDDFSWPHQSVRHAEELFGIDANLNSAACPDDLRSFFDWAFLPEVRHRTVATRLMLRVMESVWPRLDGFEQMDLRHQSVAVATLLSTYDILHTGVVIALACRSFPPVQAAFAQITGFEAWIAAYAPPKAGELATEFAIKSLNDYDAPTRNEQKELPDAIHKKWERLQELSGFVTAIADYADPCMRAEWAAEIQRSLLDVIDTGLKQEGIDPVLRTALNQANETVLRCHAWVNSSAPALNRHAAIVEKSLNWARSLLSVCVAEQEKIEELRRKIKRLAQDPIAKANELQLALACLNDNDPTQNLQSLMESRPSTGVLPVAKTSADAVQEDQNSTALPVAASPDLEHTQELLQTEREKNQRAGEKISALQDRLQAMEARLSVANVTPKREIMACVQDPISPEVALAVAAATRPLLQVLPSARSSARKSAVFRHGRKLLELLLDLGDGYAQTLRSGQPDAVARAVLGDAYRAQESEVSLSSKDCRQARTFLIGDKPVLMKQHLAIGVTNSITETIRVHFAWIDGRIVIGHCGEHLPLNASA